MILRCHEEDSVTSLYQFKIGFEYRAASSSLNQAVADVIGVVGSKKKLQEINRRTRLHQDAYLGHDKDVISFSILSF